MTGSLARRLVHLALAAAVALALAPAGCGKHPDDGTDPRAVEGDLPSLTLKDDTANLMLTWVDERGETHVELHPNEVPANGRDLVRVVVADREEGTHELFWVADLTKKDGDAYVVRTMRRRDWEDTIAKRRDAWLQKNAPPPPTAAPLPPIASGGEPPPAPLPPPTGGEVGAGVVVIYGASWCGACHEAARWLKAHNVPFVEKDVDEDPRAVAEMKAKLAKAGMRYTGSIPVIDVRGHMMIGFSGGELSRLLKSEPSGTML